MLFEICYRISRLLFLLLLTRESSPTDCRPTVGRLSTVGRRGDRPSTDSSSESIPTVGQLSTDCGRLSVDSRPTVDRLRAKVHLIRLFRLLWSFVLGTSFSYDSAMFY